jgi:hypothetical protein
MIFLLFAWLVIFGILYIIMLYKNSPYNKTILNFLKQGLITLILFNAFNISFCAGLHWKYADPTDQYYIVSTIAMIISLALMIIATLAI